MVTSTLSFLYPLKIRANKKILTQAKGKSILLLSLRSKSSCWPLLLEDTTYAQPVSLAEHTKEKITTLFPSFKIEDFNKP